MANSIERFNSVEQLTPRSTARNIEAILKITERCNINCNYCYFFNMHNKDFEKHPPLISRDTVESVGKFLAQGARELGARRVIVDLHGGEPMLMKKQAFVAICDQLKAAITPVADLRLKIQTNATLVDQEWIDIFSAYDFTVGVSIDGPQEENDRNRVDHQGRGTYAATAQGLTMLLEAASLGRIREPGILCVANPYFDGARVYRHFVHDLKVRGIDFLLPLESYDTIDPATIGGYGKFLVEAFDAWAADDNPRVRVRIFRQHLQRMAAGNNGMRSFETMLRDAHASVTISSNGDINPDDTLRASHGNWFSIGHTVNNMSLKNYLNLPFMLRIWQAAFDFPSKCQECDWRQICRGGRLVNRFSIAQEFARESVICADLRMLYGRLASYLLANNFPMEKLLDTLGNDVRFAENEAALV
jgi:uncharacterized protein